MKCILSFGLQVIISLVWTSSTVLAGSITPPGTDGQVIYNNSGQWGAESSVGLSNGGTGATNASDALYNIEGSYNPIACGGTSPPVWCAGSDLGAYINAAVAHIGSSNVGRIVIPPTSTPIAYSTPIVMGLNIILDCQGSQLNFTPTTTLAALTIAGNGSNLTGWNYHTGKVTNCAIVHSSGYTNGNTNVGFFQGGDPNNVFSSSTAFGPAVEFDNVTITGFFQGIALGNNAWNLNWYGGKIAHNYDGIYDGSGQSNSGEAADLVGVVIFNNSHCGMNALNYNHEWLFEGSRWDYNAEGICGSGLSAKFTGNTHFEQNTAPFITITSSANVVIDPASVWIATSTVTGSGLFYFEGSSSVFNIITIHNLTFGGNHTPAYVVFTNGAGSTRNMDFVNIADQTATPFTANTDAPTTTVTRSAETIVGTLNATAFSGPLTGAVVSPTFALNGTAYSGTAWTTTSPVWNIPPQTLTDTTGSGTVAVKAAYSLMQPTFTSTSSQTDTLGATLYIDGAPVAGTNNTISNRYAIYTPGSASFAGGIFGLSSVNSSLYSSSSGKVFISSTAPTITSGFGTSPTLGTGPASDSFDITIGSTPGTSGVIGMPTGTNNWNCHANDVTTPAELVFMTAHSNTSMTLSFYNSSLSLTAPTAADDIAVVCMGH